MSSPKINVLCLVSSLCVGGAEKHTVTLANLPNPSAFNVHLGYLKPIEALLNQVREELATRTFCLHVGKQVIDGKNGFLYEPGDIEALTDKLAGLQLQSTRKRMGSASRERVESLFSESRMMEQFELQIQAFGRRAN